MITKRNRLRYGIVLLIIIQIVTIAITVYHIDKHNAYKKYMLQENRNTLRYMKECIEDANIVLTKINRNKELIAEDIATLTYDYQTFAMGMDEMGYMHSFINDKDFTLGIESFYRNIYNYLSGVNSRLEHGNDSYRESYDEKLYMKMQSITKRYLEIFREYELDTVKDILPILKEIEGVNNNTDIIGGFPYL